MHPEVLDEKRKRIFSRLHNFRKFYLAGGTALALQMGHRTSVDFDLFTHKEIPESLLQKVGKTFPGAVVKPLVNNKDELTVLVDDVKVTFFNHIFRTILKLVRYEDVNLLSVKEIAADKAHAIGRRGKYRDYVDLYFIIKGKHSSLTEIIHLSEKKFGPEFNGRLFLEQMIYLEDIKDDPILFLKETISKKAIKKFFEQEVKNIRI